MTIAAIVATAKNGVIGYNGQIPWYLPADLKYFKKCTLGHAIIMGRGTFTSIGRPLPKRTNIIITRNMFFTATGSVVTHSLEEAIEAAREQGEEKVFIIGGGEIYRQSADLWDEVYLTTIDLEVEGDTFFPELPKDQWERVSRECHPADEKNGHAYCFERWKRSAR